VYDFGGAADAADAASNAAAEDGELLEESAILDDAFVDEPADGEPAIDAPGMAGLVEGPVADEEEPGVDGLLDDEPLEEPAIVVDDVGLPVVVDIVRLDADVVDLGLCTVDEVGDVGDLGDAPDIVADVWPCGNEPESAPGIDPGVFRGCDSDVDPVDLGFDEDDEEPDLFDEDPGLFDEGPVNSGDLLGICGGAFDELGDCD